MKLPIQKQIFDSNHIELKDADGNYIAIVDKESDADEIVKIMNEHHEFLKAIEGNVPVMSVAEAPRQAEDE